MFFFLNLLVCLRVINFFFYCDVMFDIYKYIFDSLLFLDLTLDTKAKTKRETHFKNGFVDGPV
jgi:hypothetical protein